MSFSVTKFFLAPVCLYFLWVTVYFIINFVVSADRIRQRNYESMFVYYDKQGWAHRILYRLGNRMAPAIFLSLHFLFFLTCHCFSILCYYSQVFNTLALVFWLTWSIQNGASFYMDYFSKKYEVSLQKLEQVEQQLNEK
uniref:Glycerophosphocholine acyltransferase 1 n=1 Tax=Strombidium inclinatum TaxID=197538 RepID=A0A7S3MV10_9SPIT|mmetsp:Transcript_15872/g.24426  ORF Transcript_15872/g.24426 Transcript_15872/m.24426 type:complete len:139 (+) Transcript_15872:1157-1573(+)